MHYSIFDLSIDIPEAFLIPEANLGRFIRVTYLVSLTQSDGRARE